MCAAAADSIGVVEPLVPRQPRLGSMVRTITAYFSGRHRSYLVGTTTVAVQGRLVVVDNLRVMLTDRERNLLHALLDASGAIRSKEDLLRSVWRMETDAHVVEVNVARLRQRLGPAAEGIETVFRRGYRWAGVVDVDARTGTDH